MARIYIARTTGIGSFERHVVLKLITPERANDVVAVQMFLDEARLAASLNHQNVAQVFEVGEDAGIHYLAMEYVHGQDLRALLAKAGSQGTRVPLDLALTVVAGAAAGLNHAHERRDGNGVPLGIVHRDVSPSNIMIGIDGAVKLLDFGIAKAAARTTETVSGVIKGKFAYMSPEQCRGREVDRRSDVFSLGIILYEVTTQHRCFRADSDFDTMHRIVTGDVVRPTRLVQGYPQALEAIVMKALATDPNQRYQSAGLLLEALEAFAVAARMPLSTTGLGRFMRELFGDIPEPWLTAPGRASQPLPKPKESTISSTNGSESPARPASETSLPRASQSMQAATLLDLPSHHLETEPDDDRVEWNARSYPAMQPSSAQALPPGSIDRSRPTPEPSSTAAAMAPVAAVPAPTPAAEPAKAGIPSTRTGYASGGGGLGTAMPMGTSEVSYPRYEPPVDADELRVRPSRSPLFIGLGLLGVGVAIVLVIGLRGKDVEPPGRDTAADVATALPRESTDALAVVAADAVPIIEDELPTTITIKVVTDPSGAVVELDGKPIGVSPVDATIPRGSGIVMLTITKPGYEEVTAKVDLAGDFSKEVSLAKVPEPTPVPVAPQQPEPEPEPERRPEAAVVDRKPPDKKTVPPNRPRPTPPQVEKKPPIPPPPVEKKPPCQPPHQIDPFDPRPPCKA
jgi:eukaryotic-like serine/threonine-protein kinase